MNGLCVVGIVSAEESHPGAGIKQHSSLDQIVPMVMPSLSVLAGRTGGKRLMHVEPIQTCLTDDDGPVSWSGFSGQGPSLTSEAGHRPNQGPPNDEQPTNP